MRELDGGLFQLQPWRLTLNGESETPKPALLTSGFTRSEEHTSELQSQSNLVCRLLLEKKKNTATSSTRSLRHRLASRSSPFSRRTSARSVGFDRASFSPPLPVRTRPQPADSCYSRSR